MQRYLAPSLFLVCATSFALGSTIHVPADQPTIQAGINAAVKGDTVLVAPGTYLENINFNGKAITVKSASGSKVTIIDGGKVDSVVTFASGETLKSVLSGFTLQHGNAASYFGGGVNIVSASPSVKSNVIQNNTACAAGGGISSSFGSPLIQGNIVAGNSQFGCSGGDGAGIYIGGASSARIIGNVIANNTWGSGDGGGIALFAAGSPTVMNNIIKGNTATGVSPASQGGGIYIVNQSDALIVQNSIYGNSAGQGGGIYFGVPSGDRGPILVNNTIAANNAPQGSAVYADGFDDQVVFFNNLMIGSSGGNAVDCDGSYDAVPPTFTNNDAFSANGSGLTGTCAAQSAENGNISADPTFVNATKDQFKLKAGSPAINKALNSAPDLPLKDLASKPRIDNGIIDMGAFEF